MLTQRRLTPEHMDEPDAMRADLDVALRFLRKANARLGGTNAALRQFQIWAKTWPRDASGGVGAAAGTGTIRVLDIGSGSADIPLALARWARSNGHRLRITAVDRHPVTCDLAREFLRSQGDEAAKDIDIVQHDALRLTDVFASGSFDYAHTGLFLHHLHDVEVLTLLTIMDRLTTRGMIWNDLVRVRWPRLMMGPFLIGAPAIVKHDAIVSAQAGFTRREAFDLAHRAGWMRPTWRRHLVHRFTLAASKTA